MSLEVNPAGLAFMTAPELAYSFSLPSDDLEGVLNQGHAVFFAGGWGGFGLGAAVQWLSRPELGADRTDYRKYTLATGIGSSNVFSVGAAMNFFGNRSDERLNDLRTWDVGAQWRPSRYLGFSLFARDINAAFLVADEALPRRFGGGAALRLWDGRLVFDAEMMRVQGVGSSLTPRVSFEPYGGLRVFGRTGLDFSRNSNDSLDWRWTYVTAGLEVSFEGFGAQGAGMLNQPDGDRNLAGSSGLVWLSPGKREPLIGPSPRWVLVELDQSIAEQAARPLFGQDTRAFLGIVEDLDKITRDPEVSGVIFRIGNIGLGFGQMWELRQQIERLHAAGKRTISVVSNMGTRQAYLASGAQEVWMIPISPYFPTGFNAQFISYQQALENLGIEAEFVRIGDYKTAPEAYIKPQPSDEALEQTTAYLDALYAEVTRGIAAPRQLEQQRIVEIIDNIPLLPHEALEQRLVDELLYPEEMDARLREKHRIRRVERGYQPTTQVDRRWGRRPEIAVVYIDGTIIDGRSGRAPFTGELFSGSQTIIETLDALERNPGVRAIVVRIDSPGGSAVGSDLIYRKLRRVSQRKPVIASMGNVAASGGYYVAAGASEIFATPVTLTGSIGIFAGKFNVERLFGTIGINATHLTRGERAGLFNLTDPWTPEERAAVASSINYMYRVFLHQVAQTRPLTEDEIDAVGRGRVWTGAAALEKRLVDRSGGLLDAIRRAEQLAGLQPDQADINAYPSGGGLLGMAAGVSAPLPGAGHTNLARGGSLSDAFVPGATAHQLIQNLETRALLPLLFAPGEALMLPSHAIVID